MHSFQPPFGNTVPLEYIDNMSIQTGVRNMSNFPPSDDQLRLLDDHNDEDQSDDELLTDHGVNTDRTTSNDDGARQRTSQPASGGAASTSVVYSSPTGTMGNRMKMCTIAVMTLVNLLNYMDRYTVAGKG